MLCGLPPFYSKDREKLYRNIKYNDPKLDMPYLSEPARDICRRLLTKDPEKRLGAGERGAQEIREHPWFDSINWELIYEKKIPPPYIPQLDNQCDTKHFPAEFVNIKLSPSDMESLKDHTDKWDGFSYGAGGSMTQNIDIDME
jgi:serine/threonine protein kinase